jgi:alpha-1,2-mannosyltransferase
MILISVPRTAGRVRLSSTPSHAASWLAASFCIAIGLYDVLYLLTQRDGLLIGPRIGALFPDFLTFLAATRAWLEGAAPMIYDLTAFTQFQTEVFSGRFGSQPGFRPFFYPPTWLLMLLPLASLAAGTAYAVFMFVTAGLASILAGRRTGWGAWLAILTSPAAVWVIVAGQNTFLSVALFYGGLHVLNKSQPVAGILLGLLSYKPQLWILVPVALVAARQWRAFSWMAATIVVVSLVSVAIFGPEVWRAFLISAREGAAEPTATEMFNTFRNQLVTIFGAGRIVGFSAGTVSVLQLGGAALAAATVWYGYRRHAVDDASIALLVAATFFVGPYTMNYDLFLLMPAVVVMFRKGVLEQFRPGELLVCLLLWLLPTLGWVLNQLSLPIMPIVVLAFGAHAATRMASRKVLRAPPA